MRSQSDAFRVALRRVAGVGAVVGVVVIGHAGCEAFGMMPSGATAVTTGVTPPCINTCQPDPGWGPPDPGDCQMSATLEQFPILTFDGEGQSGDPTALDMYMYTDGTAQPLFIYTSPTGTQQASLNWQPPTERADICPGADAGAPAFGETLTGSGNYVLHMMGGFAPPSQAVGTPPPGSIFSLGNDNSVDSCGVGYAEAPTAFRGYGGGIGIAMHQLNNSDGHGDMQKGICAPNMVHPYPSLCPPTTAEPAVQIASLDVSSYDGVSFWARRGPESQEGVHVLVGDKYTDDDLSYITYRTDPTLPRHCERVRQCSCSNHAECSYLATPQQIEAGACEYAPGCGGGQPQALLAPPSSMIQTAATPGGPGYYCSPVNSLGGFAVNGQNSFIFCSPLGVAIPDTSVATACDLPYPAYPNDFPDGGYDQSPCSVTPLAGTAGDRQFWGKPCTPYEWTNGTGGAFCFDPATDPPPADPTERCGDHWMETVDLSTEWKFYMVPFTDLRQQGFAKKSEQIDLHSVSVVRFTWDAGWIDYWIDQVAFYRNPT